LHANLAFEPVKLSKKAQRPDRRGFVINETIAEAERAVKAAETASSRSNPPVLELIQPLGHPFIVATVFARYREGSLLVDLDLELARTRFQALKAVLLAESWEEDGHKESPEWKRAATGAMSLQRKVAVVEARRNMLLAGQERRRAATKPQIDTAD